MFDFISRAVVGLIIVASAFLTNWVPVDHAIGVAILVTLSGAMQSMLAHRETLDKTMHSVLVGFESFAILGLLAPGGYLSRYGFVALIPASTIMFRGVRLYGGVSITMAIALPALNLIFGNAMTAGVFIQASVMAIIGCIALSFDSVVESAPESTVTPGFDGQEEFFKEHLELRENHRQLREAFDELRLKLGRYKVQLSTQEVDAKPSGDGLQN
uniref:hypothetical protein n=1 Tax=Armatimonas sp. TaxID=1872638 RepID=UPI00286AF441